jgi:integrase
LNAYVGDVRGFYQDLGLTEVPMQFETTVAEWLTTMRERRNPQGRWAWGAKTTSRKLTSLRSYGVYLGYGEILKYYTLPKAAKSDPQPLPGGVEDVMRLIELARSDSERALVAMMGLCGMRVHEALARAPQEFDFRERVIRINRGKGMKDRVVPMSDEARSAILDAVTYARLEGRPFVVEMGDRVARRHITQLAARAGMQGVASHMLRATFATEAYDHTKDIVAVQELLGHSSITTTRGYVGKSMDNMRAAVAFSNRPKLGQ